MSLNRTQHIGNITRLPEVKFTPKGTAVTDLSIAVNRVWNDANGQRQEDTTFLDITFWGKQAELIGKLATKGRQIYVEGRLSIDSWEDKQTGQKRQKMRIVGETFQLLGAKPAGNGNGQGDGEPRGQQQPMQEHQNHGGSGHVAEEDDDIKW